MNVDYYTAALRRLEKRERKDQIVERNQCSKPSKPGFEGFEDSRAQEALDSHVALSALWGLYREHRRRLEAGGYSANQARVRLIDWRERCGLSPQKFFALLEPLKANGRVQQQGCYVRPGVVLRRDSRGA